MAVNLKREYAKITQYLKQRVRGYPVYVNEGPGEDEDPISQITVGFDFDQSGWVALVFDTRPKASPDGEWNNYIEQNMLECDHWARWPGKLTLLDGSSIKLEADPEPGEVAGYFGEMLQQVLCDARDAGLFDSLPTTADCQLCVEHFEGHFGSLDYLDKRPAPVSEKQIRLQMASKVGRLPIDEQVKFWIGDLDQLFAGKSSSSSLYSRVQLPLDSLEQIGEQAVLPMLALCYKWSRYPEFAGDRPKRIIEDTPVGACLCAVIIRVGEMGYKSPAIEKQLLRVLKRAMETNASRRLWGPGPVNVARVLNQLFDYPTPTMHDTTNRLVNAAKFLK